MDNTTRDVKQFFGPQELLEERLSEMAQREELKEIIAKKAKDQKLPLPEKFYTLMLKQAVDLLDMKIRAILVTAWSKYQELQKYCDPDQYPADETFHVSLAEHTILETFSFHGTFS